MDGLFAMTTASRRLLALSLPADASLVESVDALALRVKRGPVEVVVTVPRTVREWFVTAIDALTDARVHDWFDYDGHDDSSEEARDLSMADDVSRFVEQLLVSEIRLEPAGRGRLLWRVADGWKQAVPFR